MSVKVTSAENLWRGRRPAPGLALMVDQLWPRRVETGVVLTLGDPPSGSRVVERYAVMPRVETARMLVPLSRRAAPRALTAYNRLRPMGTRIRKRAGATAFAAGLTRPLARDVLTVCAPGSARADRRHEILLLAHLGHELGVAPVVAAIGISSPAPNRKPTVQLFDHHGRALGYAKVGWNDYTRDLVRHETAVLTHLAAAAPEQAPRRPAVLAAGEWRGLEILVTAPLPRSITAQSPGRWPPPGLTLDVAGWGPRSDRPLCLSTYLEHLRRELEQARASGSLTAAEHADAAAFLERVLLLHKHTLLRYGAWHGDWSPWNIGTAEGSAWVWDWEHFDFDAPVGLDLVHYAFQRNFVLKQRPVEESLTAVETRIGPRLAAVGVDEGNAGLLTSLYLLEMLLRACRMHRLGAGWNDRFRSGALSAVRNRNHD